MRIVDSIEKYAAAKGLGNVYHLPGWKAAFDVYSLKTYWLVAEKDSTVVARLPLVRQSSRLFGCRLISLPWVDEAGAVGDPDGASKLLCHAREMANCMGARFATLIKQPLENPVAAPNLDWTAAGDNKVVMRLELGGSSEHLWKRLSAKVRNQVRKAQNSGLITERCDEGYVDDFYAVYARNMRDLGSPSHSVRFFQTLFASMREHCIVYRTRLKNKTVGAGFLLKNGTSLDIPWAASLREYNELCVNHSLYWKILSDAADERVCRFSFGRSTVDSGQYRFKKQWGAVETPLAWVTQDPQRLSSEEKNAAPLQERFGAASRLWSKLPLWAAKRIGPQIIRLAP